MTEVEYLDSLKKIYNLANSDDAEKYYEENIAALKDLYSYKPVRLLWFVVRSKVEENHPNYDKYLEKMNSIICGKDRFEGTGEYLEYIQEIHLKEGNYDAYYSMWRRYGYNTGQDEIKRKMVSLFEKYSVSENNEDLFELMICYFQAEQAVMFHVIMAYFKSIHYSFPQKIDHLLWRNNDVNIQYLQERIDCLSQDFIITVDENNQSECDLLAYILHKMGHKVYMIMPELECDPDEVRELTKKSLINEQVYEDATCYFSYGYINGDGELVSNKGSLIREITEKKCFRGYAIIIASGNNFESFSTDYYLRKTIEEMTWFSDKLCGDLLQWGRVGNYLAYCSDLYLYDVEESLNNRLNNPSKVDFSIVIPARNSAGTLYYTLKTCLNQDYEGSFEIVVSDNSTSEYHEVKQVCMDLNDSRIRYVKTPRKFPLTKSFEFALLQAEGEFIISLGSDDGMCPWGLTEIKKVINEYPNEEVLQWKRGYYCWKGFPGAKEGLLSIPGQFDRNNIKVWYEDRLTYFAKVLKYSFNRYSLPTLYVNSGFHKSFFRTLLKDTGRLWDGFNQDLYIGVTCAAIKNKILNVDFPMTIVGISTNSLGYTMSRPMNEEQDAELDDRQKSSYLGDNVCQKMFCSYEKLIPASGNETFALYSHILMAIRLGILPENWIYELLDFKKIFREFYEELSFLDENYDRFLQDGVDAARRHGEEFEKWFMEEIYGPIVYPKKYVPKDEGQIKQLSYNVGITEDGELFLNANEYGVSNIFDAVTLFENKLEWREESWK